MRQEAKPECVRRTETLIADILCALRNGALYHSPVPQLIFDPLVS